MDEDAKEILMNIEEILRGILRASVAERLAQIRADKTLRRIYDLTGRNRTVASIAREARVSTGKVSGIWQSWEEAGLLTKRGKSYRKLSA